MNVIDFSIFIIIHFYIQIITLDDKHWLAGEIVFNMHFFGNISNWFIHIGDVLILQ